MTAEDTLPRITALAIHVWDDEADAHAFLHTAHPMLGNRTPAEVAMDDAGAHKVEKILWSLYYGLPA